MKKLVLVAAVVLLLSGLAVYGGGSYPEVKSIMEKVALSLEKFVIRLERAENADHIVDALDNYTDEILPLAPKMKEVIKKYPELKELKDADTYPEELKPVLKKIEELEKRMVQGFTKLQKYADDPKVKEAQARWFKAMAALEGEEEKEKKEQEKDN